MAEPTRVVLIGLGGIAQAYLQALRQVPELELTSAIDVYRPRAEAAIGDSGARTFDSVDAMLAEAPCDAALVLTPPNTHEALSIRLLQAGVHVLCEKPLTTSTQSAMRMLQAAAASRRLLMMGSKFRYTPDVAAAHRLLRDGVCGDVVMYENVFCSHVDMTSRWNSRLTVAGGGVLIDNGCHSVDVARFLLGPIARVQAQFGRRAQPIEVEDTAQIGRAHV